MIVERSTVTWGTTTIPYEVRRSTRRGTVSLLIDPERGLVVTAPDGTPILRLDAVVKSKARWIVERLQQNHRPPTPPSKEFVSGEGFLYLGRQYRLRVTRGAPEALSLHRGWLDLPIPKVIGPAHRQAYTRAALIDWYVGLARERLPVWAEAWAARMGVRFKKAIVTNQAKRWGSCSQGVVRINWRIIQALRPLFDYVLAHELVHLQHDDHGRAFWQTLGRAMPDYDARKARLRDLGPALVW
jgi:predicted metal-dependent hydrolase